MPALSDPAVLLALELAASFPDAAAAGQVVASAAASAEAQGSGSFEDALYEAVLPVKTASCAGKTLADADYNKQAKDALLKALIAAGVASGID